MSLFLPADHATCRRFSSMIAGRFLCCGVTGSAHTSPPSMSKYGCGALWAAMIYFMVALLLRSRPQKQILTIAALVCAPGGSVETEPYAGARHFPPDAGRRLAAGANLSPGIFSPMRPAWIWRLASTLCCRAAAATKSRDQETTRDGGADFLARPGGRRPFFGGGSGRRHMSPAADAARYLSSMSGEILEQSRFDLRLVFEPGRSPAPPPRWSTAPRGAARAANCRKARRAAG